MAGAGRLHRARACIRDRRHPRWKLAIGSGGPAANQQAALKAIAHQPFRHALLILVAVALAGYALWRLFRAALGHGPEGSDSTLDRMAAFGSGIAEAGLCALAVEILLSSRSDSSTLHETAAGLFGWTAGIVKAAVEFNPNKAVGLDGALAKLANASYGPYVLGVVATGLVGFGIYSLADARYRRI